MVSTRCFQHRLPAAMHVHSFNELPLLKHANDLSAAIVERVKLDAELNGRVDCYQGRASIGLMLWKHHRCRAHDPNTLAVASSMISDCLAPSEGRDVPSFVLGLPGVFAIAAAISHDMGDLPATRAHTNRMNNWVSLHVRGLTSNSSTPNEVLYGRAGFLYTCAFMNRTLKETVVHDAAVQPVVDRILVEGRSHPDKPPGCPLMWEWHHKQYTGAAHGLVGIIHMLLMCRRLLSKADLLDVVATLDYVLSTRFPGSGNLPSSYPVPGDNSSSDRLVQWCHGAVGLGITCAYAYECLRDQKYLQAARECASVVWERGLVRKLSLCHGIAGNLYTFLALRRAELDAGNLAEAEVNLHRARQFASFLVFGEGDDSDTTHGSIGATTAASSASSSQPAQTGSAPGMAIRRAAPKLGDAHWQRLVAAGEIHGGDSPLSLFEGAAGVVVALLDVCRPDDAFFPGYELPPA